MSETSALLNDGVSSGGPGSQDRPPIEFGDQLRLKDVQVAEGVLEGIAPWTSLEQVNQAFEVVRDGKPIVFQSKRRRLNWLVPSDGQCFYRGGISAGALLKAGFPRVSSLTLRGTFLTCPQWKDGGPDDRVSFMGVRRDGAECVIWTWHNAPAVRVGKQVYVLDPVVNYERPVTLAEWLAADYKEATHTQELVLQLGMDGIASESKPEFDGAYGYPESGQGLAKRLGAFVKGYEVDNYKRHPLLTEWAKVAQYHSERVTKESPPWLGIQPGQTGKWADVESQVQETCQAEQTFYRVLIQLKARSSATMVRLPVSRRVLNSGKFLYVSLIDPDQQVIQFNLAATASHRWAGTRSGTVAVLGDRATIDAYLSTEQASSCEEALALSRRVVAGELQARVE